MKNIYPGLYHIGVTGTREGASDVQVDEAFSYLRATGIVRGERFGQRCVVHHGDCVGFDAEAAGMARELGMLVVSHPPIQETFRAHFPSDVECQRLGYHARDGSL